MTSEKTYDLEQRFNNLITAGGGRETLTGFYPDTVDVGRTAATYVDDPYLTVPVVNGGVYDVRLVLRYSGGNGASAGFLKWVWSHPGGNFRLANMYNGTGGGFVMESKLGSDTALAAFTSGVTNFWPLQASGIYYCGGDGALTLQWGCQVNTGTQTHVQYGSYLRAIRIG